MDSTFEEAIELFDDIYSEFLLEATTSNKYIIRDNLYPKIESVLSTSVGDKKFKQLVGNYIDRNYNKLHTAGPMYLIPFGDIDKAQFLEIFSLKPSDITTEVDKVIKNIGSNSDFKLLRQNYIFWVFYCCIRYYALKKDETGLNIALSIYALSVYPSVFSVFFKYGVNEPVMQYTMDNLSKRYIMKKEGSLFNGLITSIHHSYDFLKQFIADGSDTEVIRFIQRIRNDQKSMMKYICDEYMANFREGNRIAKSQDSHEGIIIVDGSENNTSVVELTTKKIVLPIITTGVDINRCNSAASMAGISKTDCRYYLTKIITVKYTEDITKFVEAILFLFLYVDGHTKEDINSLYFLSWSSQLFRKTNSNDKNISTIKATLDKWGQETGVHAKFKRIPSRVNYKKAIFFYFILSIQYFNK